MRVLQLATSPRSFFENQVDALESRGVECTVVTVPNAGDSRRPGSYLRFALRTLACGLDQFDVVHANYGLTAPFAFAQPTRPLVVTLWGSDVMGDAWLRRLSLTAAERADAVVVPWRTISDELDVDHDVIPFEVDSDRFHPIDRSEARARVGWPGDTRIVLFPYDPRRPVKNFPLAERVVGRLSFDAELRAVSGAPHDVMPLYMNASDAVLVTSERESGPMVVREAVACNVPVVSTDVGTVSDIIADVENAHVARTESGLVDGLDAVLDDGGRSNGRSVVEGREGDGMGSQLLSVYRRTCGSR